MGNDDRGNAVVARVEDHSHDRFAVRRVQGAGGLVGEKQAATSDDGPRDRDALTLATRQLVGKAAGPVRES